MNAQAITPNQTQATNPSAHDAKAWAHDASAGHSPVPAFVREYTERLRMEAKVRQDNDAHLLSGYARWWAQLDAMLRVYLLSTLQPADWQKYEAVTWGALPSNLRQALIVHARAVRRELSGCEWR